MTNRFFDLSFDTLDNGAIRLKQSDVGEDSIIDANPEQILFVARTLCGFKTETFQKVADLERRLAVLTDKLQNIVCDKGFRTDLLDQCGDGLWYLSKLDAVTDLACEWSGIPLEPQFKDDNNPDQTDATEASKPASQLSLAGL